MRHCGFIVVDFASHAHFGLGKAAAYFDGFQLHEFGGMVTDGELPRAMFMLIALRDEVHKAYRALAGFGQHYLRVHRAGPNLGFLAGSSVVVRHMLWGLCVCLAAFLPEPAGQQAEHHERGQLGAFGDFVLYVIHGLAPGLLGDGVLGGSLLCCTLKQAGFFYFYFSESLIETTKISLEVM